MKGGDSQKETMTDKDTETMDGIVIRAQTGVYYVQHNSRVIECTLRGKVKREFQAVAGGKRKNIYSDPVAVGDRVTITVAESDKGAIETVMPRTSKLSRKAAGSYLKMKSKQTRIPRRLKARGSASGGNPIEQIVVANADQLLVTLSTKMPKFSPALLDRFLVVAEAGELEAVICVNKMDLLNGGEREELYAETRIYEDIGYKVLHTSALEREGLEELTGILKDKLTALAGPSGAGKSTLLNTIQPHLNIRTGEVSDKTSKGKHITTNVELHLLDFGGYVVDTPGIRELGLWDVWKDEMHQYFPEIEPLVIECRFSNCSHVDEEGCAVIEAVAQGKIARTRHESYLKLREGVVKNIAEAAGKFSDRRVSDAIEEEIGLLEQRQDESENLGNKLTDVVLTFNSGRAGIAYWINSYLKLDGADRMDEDHEAIGKIKEWLDEEMDAGQFGEVPEDEILEQIGRYLPHPV